MFQNHHSKPKYFFIGLCCKSKQILTTTMKMFICFLVILLGVTAADKPESRDGEPKPVETNKPIAYRPVVFQIVPVIESTTPGNGGKIANLKAKIASKKGAILSKVKKVKPYVLGFKAGAILTG